MGRRVPKKYTTRGNTTCPRCDKPVSVTRRIFRRYYDDYRRAQGLWEETVGYCSEEHAIHDQMAMEG